MRLTLLLGLWSLNGQLTLLLALWYLIVRLTLLIGLWPSIKSHVLFSLFYCFLLLKSSLAWRDCLACSTITKILTYDWYEISLLTYLARSCNWWINYLDNHVVLITYHLQIISVQGVNVTCSTSNMQVTVITWLQGTPQYPRGSVPTSQVSLHHRCPVITGVPSSQVSLHRRCPVITGVPSSQVSLHHRCPYITGVPSSKVSLHHRCPFIKGVPTSQVSLHHMCPYITGFPSSIIGVLTSQVSLHHRCPYITGVLTSKVSQHHRFPNMGHQTEKMSPHHRVSPHHRCPLKTGFTVYIRMGFKHPSFMLWCVPSPCCHWLC